MELGTKVLSQRALEQFMKMTFYGQWAGSWTTAWRRTSAQRGPPKT